jgi:hypothetical protein
MAYVGCRNVAELTADVFARPGNPVERTLERLERETTRNRPAGDKPNFGPVLIEG